MASSSPPPPMRYDVFASYSGKEVRPTLISHLRKQLSSKGITIFDDEIIRKGPIAPLIQTIRESKISIIVLSKKYASDRRCFDELLEILKCQKETGHIAIPIFFGVQPSDVRRQGGEFGIAFREMCAGKTEEEIRKWSDALHDVTNIMGLAAGERGIDADFVEKIAREVSNILLRAASATNNNPIGESESRCCTGVAIIVVINLLLEIASAVSDQLSFINKLYFARISFVISILSVLLSIVDIILKIRDHKARFECKLPIPWFHYPSPGYDRTLGSLTDRILWLCALGQFIVSAVNWGFIETGRDGPIKLAIMALIFAIALVVSKFMEKATNSNDNSCNRNVSIHIN